MCNNSTFAIWYLFTRQTDNIEYTYLHLCRDTVPTVISLPIHNYHGSLYNIMFYVKPRGMFSLQSRAAESRCHGIKSRQQSDDRKVIVLVFKMSGSVFNLCM